MTFKEKYFEDNFYSQILVEATGNEKITPEDKEEIKDADEKAGVSKRVGRFGILTALSKLKDILSKEETKKGLKLAGKVIDAIDGATSAMRGSGAGGGIFTSILRYNNPILKKITPEKESMDMIEEIIKKLDFHSSKTDIITVTKFRKMFRDFIRDNPIPSEDTYEYIHDILKDVKSLNITRKDIDPNEFNPILPPKGKETPAQRKAREDANKKGEIEQKKREAVWAKKFRDFLNNDKFNTELREIIAPILIEFGIQLKMNINEIKDDLANLYKKIFTRETLEFGVSITKALKNFVLVVISVYLLKLIKKLAFG